MKDVDYGGDGWGRSPYGERGLKFDHVPKPAEGWSRSPYGERGLKYVGQGAGECGAWSLSLRRAWIEIGRSRRWCYGRHVALLTESVD